MPHIDLPGLPGITALFAFRPETAPILSQLAETLLRGESSLTRGERELIAAYVSRLNSCHFCHSSHATFAALQLEGGWALVDEVMANPDTAEISPKLRALLAVAAQVQESGSKVTEQAVNAAKTLGATDVEVHDTVLIAAAFCMFNRYVDGLATVAPPAREDYAEMGAQIVEQGYMKTP